MSRLGNLSTTDKRLLGITGCCAAALIALLAIWGPSQDYDTVPASDSNAVHGAHAAYLLLEKIGYRVTRSTVPLRQVAHSATPETTFIFADPFYQEDTDAQQAVEEILSRGGRVVVTGIAGAHLLPGKAHPLHMAMDPATCNAQPVGLSRVAASGEIQLPSGAVWMDESPNVDVAYRCGNDAVVVTYPSGKGTVVWWSSASPLENGTIGQAGNMALLLNSIGPRATTRVVWDESLHGASPSLWSYASGTVLPLVWIQCALVALLLVFSFSRRSGPLRPDPLPTRAAPLEFVRSLGSLYRKAGATNVAVSVAGQAFRLRLERAAGIGTQASPQQVVAAMERRYPNVNPKLGKALEAVETASAGPPPPEKSALKLVQLLQASERDLT